MTAPDLLPCQCGGKVHIDHFKNPTAVVVVCEKCGTDWLGYWSDSERSIAERWNTRATPAPAAMTPGVPADCRKWPFYPIQMPTTKDGKGPATIGVDAVSLSYEVWDQEFNAHASFDNLPDAINEAMRLSLAALRAGENNGK